MSQYEFDAVLEKYLAGNCTAAEEKLVFEWYDTFINESEIALSPDEKVLLEQKVWSKIETTTGIFSGQRPTVRMYQRSWFRVAAAACILSIALAGGYWYFNKQAVPDAVAFSQVRIPEGYVVTYNREDITRSLVLPDGSKIELQPQSALYYPSAFIGYTRNVYLSGNAFFQVTHDTTKHFIVHTDEGLLTEVLGTSFYVLHDKLTNKVEVSVVTGKVSVYEQKEKEGRNTAESRIILTPNQRVSYKPVNNQFVTSLVEEPKPIEQPAGSGAQPSFIFDEAPVGTILTAIENAYGIRIQTEDEKLNHCHFTGDLAKQNLYDKLDVICKSLQISYEVKGTSIYIRGKGCN